MEILICRDEPCPSIYEAFYIYIVYDLIDIINNYYINNYIKINIEILRKYIDYLKSNNTEAEYKEFKYNEYNTPTKQTESYELNEYIQNRTKKMGIEYEYVYPRILSEER